MIIIRFLYWESLLLMLSSTSSLGTTYIVCLQIDIYRNIRSPIKTTWSLLRILLGVSALAVSLARLKLMKHGIDNNVFCAMVTLCSRLLYKHRLPQMFKYNVHWVTINTHHNLSFTSPWEGPQKYKYPRRLLYNYSRKNGCQRPVCSFATVHCLRVSFRYSWEMNNQNFRHNYALTWASLVVICHTYNWDWARSSCTLSNQCGLPCCSM